MDSLPEINLVLDNLDHQSHSSHTSPPNSPQLLAGKILSDRTFYTPVPSPTGWESSLIRSNSVNGSNWSAWEDTPARTNTDTILIQFDQPDPTPNRFRHFRTLFAGQFLPLTSHDTIHMGMLESIYSSLKFAPYLKQEENYFGPAPYCDFKRMAQSQRAFWLNEVKTPRFPAGFEESNKLAPLPKEPDWFSEVTNLAVNPPQFQWHYGFSIYPSDKSKALQLLAAFSFLDISILEEQVSLTNFKWACETLLLCTIPPTATYQIHCFLDFLPIIRSWLEANAATYCFDQDLQDYALVKDRLEMLNNQIQSFQSESFEVVPAHADKKLRRCFKQKQMKRPAKEAKLQRKAKALVLSFRPLLEKKLESDAKEDMRKMELKFLQFAWNKFHSLVTRSFPHYFENKKVVAQHSDPSKA
ncbi:hypothetical protein RHMOL_Rhmol11G0001500 [Rhododendron molle]|uniref:Uncharacterized protein n=1 Tax=Rhododendron molle TaxID=49168 RepID=A0ACC0LM35_RHOML|nr:hypothetical protein RHMOL_Rhmol11G0001500 [Rhododendron molle]